LEQVLAAQAVLAASQQAAAAAAAAPITALILVLAVLVPSVRLTLSLIANMITDSKNITWTSNKDRSIWKSSAGQSLQVNPAANDEQVLSGIEGMYAIPPKEPSNEDRISDLEAQLKALIAKLSSK
jgi:hypothetical protein